MVDLNTPKPALNLARLDIDIDAQRIVIEGKELRLLEMDVERANIKADDAEMKKRADALGRKADALDGVEAHRVRMHQHEVEHARKKHNLRLLELDDEREAIRGDIDASLTHIATLEAEVSQQRTRLKESTHG